jgi:hypothetical protein
VLPDSTLSHAGRHPGGEGGGYPPLHQVGGEVNGAAPPGVGVGTGRGPTPVAGTGIGRSTGMFRPMTSYTLTDLLAYAGCR